MLWHPLQREVTRCVLFATVRDLLTATKVFFDCCNSSPDRVRPIIAAIPHGFRRRT
jgi:hypothetical protein